MLEFKFFFFKKEMTRKGKGKISFIFCLVAEKSEEKGKENRDKGSYNKRFKFMKMIELLAFISLKSKLL